MIKASLLFVRIFCVILSIFFTLTYAVVTTPMPGSSTFLFGILLGLLLGGILVGIDLLSKRFNLRVFNTIILGLFFGYLMGGVLVLLFNTVTSFIGIIANQAETKSFEIIRILLYFLGSYLGLIFTLRCSDEIYASIPFIKLTPTHVKKKDLLLDVSVLCDARIIDLGASGIVDYSLILPKFVVKELYIQSESSDEMIRNRARRGLDNLKKLEHLTDLGLRYTDTDYNDTQDLQNKLMRLARLLNTNILTADISKVQMATIDDIKIVNIHMLSMSLKPLTQAGELIKVKVQRYGKEAGQGVGYLEDGTMVVINGGGHHIAETIIARVLSVKHTASGRMVFCNSIEDESGSLDDLLYSSVQSDPTYQLQESKAYVQS